MISQRYDLDAGALYIKLTERHRQVARTAQLDSGTMVDLDSDGYVLGIEVIQPGRDWPLSEILDRFTVADYDAAELRAYFAHPAQLLPPDHPSPPVQVDLQLLAAR